jgi:hypothetical protein
MYGPLHRYSTAAGATRLWNGSAEALPFFQFAPGRVDPEAHASGLDQPMCRWMPDDLLNAEQFDGDEPYTGEMPVVIVQFFLIGSFCTSGLLAYEWYC